MRCIPVNCHISLTLSGMYLAVYFFSLLMVQWMVHSNYYVRVNIFSVGRFVLMYTVLVVCMFVL